MFQNRGILEVASRSDTGRVRAHNEDCVATAADIGLVILADGMGGHQAGEVASGIATDLITHEIRIGIPKIFEATTADAGNTAPQTRLLRRAIERANSAIYEASSSQSHLAGMGTTVVALLFWLDKVSVAHVGDSRVYRWRGDTLERITKDHSLIQELMDRGLCTLDQARISPNRHLVTRALGLDATVKVDVAEQQVAPNDVFLLCSDGLTDMVIDADILLVLKTLKGNLEQTAAHLIDIANDNGGRDNVSVILTRLRPDIKHSWRARIYEWVSNRFF